ncbi:P-loop containing nucleoside triphosphate hydrolases superfamily protein [Thalictrum thalictroides]|uniref:P-loop containing nucleoside triphosphate hydrolases superfamily protein n=1 Tax=Thalictrum thalictroides TaxID=46969 RepID=A0A7J6WAI2_THATH|nr:P-loop containing nucleoside triphosphate hydrolases superfamily protein [Thalictrum thalictroides]
MSGEIVQFLKKKFTDSLQENGQNLLPLSKVFVSIKEILEKKIKSCVQDHTRDMVDILYKLNEAIIECRMLSENRRKPPLPPYTIKEVYYLERIRRRLSKLKKILRTITDASNTSCSSTTVGQQDAQQTPETSRVFGFGNRMEEIVTSIQEDSSGGINKVGIVGMGGSGKTTLAQLVFDDDRVKKEFIPRIWVAPNMSETTKSIVEYLLKELGEGEDDDIDDDEIDDSDDLQHEDEREEKRNGLKKTESNKSLDDLLTILHKQLSGKKYLLVFDDVWNISVWYKSLVNYELSNNGETAYPPRGLPKGEGGGIIVTSRLAEDVKEMVEEANLHRLLPTSDEDCWSIFMEAIKENRINSEHPTLTKLKPEILENCNNLPLAAKTLGKIMSKQIRVEEFIQQ